MAQRRNSSEKKDPERTLLKFWQKKLGDAAGSSAFIDVVNDVTLRGVSHFGKTEDGMRSERAAVAQRIVDGLPLNRAQYYFALACRLLMGDHTYVEFFKYRWHETADHQGYGPKCPRCNTFKKNTAK